MLAAGNSTPPRARAQRALRTESTSSPSRSAATSAKRPAKSHRLSKPNTVVKGGGASPFEQHELAAEAGA